MNREKWSHINNEIDNLRQILEKEFSRIPVDYKRLIGVSKELDNLIVDYYQGKQRKIV